MQYTILPKNGGYPPCQVLRCAASATDRPPPKCQRPAISLSHDPLATRENPKGKAGNPKRAGGVCSIPLGKQLG
ncbi:hypothetical protein GQ53DRAFT_748612 [Thozetella sp. PMI_491]|nr:hypothetical protein GQ53DRAFT_748612 [Thozetella sp. PMI_491]